MILSAVRRISYRIPQRLLFTTSPLASTTSTTDKESTRNWEEFPQRNKIEIVSSGNRSRRTIVNYVNQSPQLFEWAQSIIHNEFTLEHLEKTTEWQAAVDAICDTTKHSNKNILNLLKSVIIMGVDPESRMVKFLESQLLDKVEEYDLKLLIEAYGLYSGLKNTDIRRKLLSAIHRSLSENLESTEANLTDLIMLIKWSRNFPPNIIIQIDQQVTRYLDYHENITLDNLCYLLVLLSRFNRRNKPLIRNVVGKLLMIKNHDVYTMPPHLINMLSALSRLSYYEVNLIEKSVDILIKFDFWAQNSDSSKRDFIVAISQFNFYNRHLIEYFMSNLVERPELFQKQDLISLCITFARLNCQQPDLIEVLKSHVLPKLENRLDFVSELQWFNFVHALTYMSIANDEHLKSLLSMDAFKKLEAEEAKLYANKIRKTISDGVPISEKVAIPDVKDIHQVMNMRRKWLAFVGLCQIREDRYKQLFDDDEQRKVFDDFVDTMEFQPMKKSKDLSIFRSKIQKLMENIVPKENYYNFDKPTKYGFLIDVELLVNYEGYPQILSDTNTNNKKVALMCVGFNDTSLDSPTELIGAKEIEFRIVRAMGYVVVPVHQNVLQDATTLGKVTFLQNLIVSHLKDSN